MKDDNQPTLLSVTAEVVPASVSLVQVVARCVEAVEFCAAAYIYDLFCRQSFVYGVHVRIDYRRKSCIIFLSSWTLLRRPLWYLCVHGTSKAIAICAIRL